MIHRQLSCCSQFAYINTFLGSLCNQKHQGFGFWLEMLVFEFGSFLWATPNLWLGLGQLLCLPNHFAQTMSAFLRQELVSIAHRSEPPLVFLLL